ncbi:MAG: hypothetical protein ACTSXH_02525 [Promethearchaeota archaeon]
MILAEFFEKYPLYKKYKCKFENDLNKINLPPINMHCEICNSIRTFNVNKNYLGTPFSISLSRGEPINLSDSTICFEYECKACNQFSHFFLIHFNYEMQEIYKAGQNPPWNIKIDKRIKSYLGRHSDIFQKGIISESQGYGIGAFSYYRRIEEEIIYKLLKDVVKIIPDKEKATFKKALNDMKRNKNSQKKIKIVQNLLPPSLTPQGLNPLKAIYDSLSNGIHSQSDNECLNDAEIIRKCIEFMIFQIHDNKEKNRNFHDNIQKLLEKKQKKYNGNN